VGRRAWLVFVVLVAVLVTASAAHAQSTVTVYFLQGEQTIAVERLGSTPADAVDALLAGPPPDEQRGRVVSELPAGLPLLKLPSMSSRSGCGPIELMIRPVCPSIQIFPLSTSTSSPRRTIAETPLM
jgi:hypothetical protein